MATSEEPFVDFLNQFTTSLRNWNHEVFGNLFRRKRHLLARLHGVQKALSTNPNPFLFKNVQELISQYNQTLKQEELLWCVSCEMAPMWGQQHKFLSHLYHCS